MKRILPILFIIFSLISCTGKTTSTNTPPEAYALFSINVQDFSYPDKSAALLDKIITLHEQYNLPVDIYITDTMAAIYAEEYPALWEHLRTSPMVAVSYHYRAPRPYANRYDWLGLEDMGAKEKYETILRYETHAVDPVSGETTNSPGGYQNVATLLGYPPYAASSLNGIASINTAVMQVYRDLGARITVTHGASMNLGDTKDGLPIRPEHKDYKLFEHTNEDAGQAFETALIEAKNNAGENTPVFIGIKMHDNNFFAEKSAWTTVYLNNKRTPNWDTTQKSTLLSQTEQDAIWSFYEETLQYVATQQGRMRIVNLPLVLEMLEKE